MKNSIRINGKRNVLGEKLKQIRLERGLTQNKVAQDIAQTGINMDQKVLSTIELGTRSIYDYEVRAFAKYYEMDYNELFDM